MIIYALLQYHLEPICFQPSNCELEL